MSNSNNWHDPIVEEIHALRERLAAQYGNDLAAYAAAATSHCLALGFQLAESPRHRTKVVGDRKPSVAPETKQDEKAAA